MKLLTRTDSELTEAKIDQKSNYLLMLLCKDYESNIALFKKIKKKEKKKKVNYIMKRKLTDLGISRKQASLAQANQIIDPSQEKKSC